MDEMTIFIIKNDSLAFHPDEGENFAEKPGFDVSGRCNFRANPGRRLAVPYGRRHRRRLNVWACLRKSAAQADLQRGGKNQKPKFVIFPA